MMTPLDVVEWLMITGAALAARWRVDTLRKARTAQLPMPQG